MLIELEVIKGLESFSVQEMRERYSTIIASDTDENLVFDWQEPVAKLHLLRSVMTVYLRLDFAVPRPKALLGHEHWTRIISAIQSVLNESFRTFTISAAGSESSVMQRIKQELELSTGLHYSQNGDLFIRIRRSASGWTVLIRTTPRPLSVRYWRVHDMEGALNGPVAFIINQSALKSETNVRYLNVMSGSGSLLCELEAMLKQVRYAVGCDLSSESLARSVTNLDQTPVSASLVRADAIRLPFADKSFDVITSDLPFGQHVGSHNENVKLYPRALNEMRRVLTQNGRCVLLTHEVRLMERLLKEQSAFWRLSQSYKIDLRGLHPRLYVLEKL